MHMNLTINQKNQARYMPVVTQKLVLTLQYAVEKNSLPKRDQIKRWGVAALFGDANLTIRFVDENEGRQLNKQFRNKDYATNVLTFDYDDVLEDKLLTGDIVLCAPVVFEEANEQKKSLEAHYAHLIVHSILHLQGYDHQSDVEAEEMEVLETKIIVGLGYPDPYADNT